MSNYWQSQIDELEEENRKKRKKEKQSTQTSTNSNSQYWQSQIDELEEENKKKKLAEERKKKNKELLSKGRGPIKDTSVDDEIAPVRKNGTRVFDTGGIGGTHFVDMVAPATPNRSTISSTIANRKLDEQRAITDSLFKTRLEEKNSVIREGSNNGPSYANYKKMQEDRENKTGRFTEEEKEKTWFQANAFKDVDSVGDALVATGKTVGGTLGDIGVNLVQGAGSMVEGIIDFGAYLLAEEAENHLSTPPLIIRGKEKEQLEAREKLQSVAGDIRDFANYDLVGDTLAPVKDFLDGNSFLGDKSDAISQGIGQIAGMYFTGGLGEAAGLGSAGASALTTGSMFFSSAGQGISEAYRAGASDNEAMRYGVLKGIADAGSELLFGGLGKGVKALGVSRGLSSLDDMFAKKLSDAFSKQVVKNFVEFGVKSSFEGFEEVLAGLGTAVAQKLSYMSDKELTQLVKDQDLFEQFVVGSVVSSLVQSGYIPGTAADGSLRESNKTGRDFITGYTQSEQSVIDRELEDRIAELEKDGEKLSKKDKDNILKEVQSDVERGYIDTDKIEEILGGDKYTAWKDADTKESELIAEYERLADTPYMELSRNEQKRLDELEAQIEGLRKKPESTRLRGELSSTMTDLLKNSRLNESYNERVRRREKFVDDLSKYTNEAARKSIQNLIDAEYANNTNKVHDFADAVAKLAESSGQVFSFVNDAQIREMGKAVDGRKVNGFITEDGIAVNLDSAKSWDFIVGHEITHAFDKANSYEALHDALKAYAVQRGEWDSRMAEMTKLYEGQDADVEAELTADLVGEYLFGDAEFINSLSTKNQNVFQKLYAEIKHLLKMVRAGSKQARQLEKAKYAFEKAMREGGKASVEGTEYSLSGINENGIEVYETSQSVMDMTWTERKAKYLDIMRNEYRGRTAKFERNGHTYYAEFDSGSLRKPIYGDSRSSVNGRKALIKAGADGDVFDLVENSQYSRSKNNIKNHTNADYFDYFVKTVQIDGKVFDVVADVEKKYGADGGYVYTLALVDNKTIKASPTHGTSKTEPVKSAGNAFDNSISQNSEKSSGDAKFPQSTDSDGRQLEEGQHSLTSELDGAPIENDRILRDEYDTQYSLSRSIDIAKGQTDYLANQKRRFVSDAELEEAQRVTSAMVDVMMKYSSILPEDKIGKVLTKNGSYDRSVENTTICVRTLAYNEFVDKVQEEIGRPLTQMESFLVSQKLYDIATEPQCLYCYVSLDRKSYNEMLLRYMQDRDTVIAKYNNSDKSASAVDALYQEFLNGRKDTKNMKTRFNKWISYADNGTQLLSLADIATNDRQSTINAEGGILAEQLKDARAYAQSASWSKIQKDYVAYRDEILKLGDRVVKNLNEHYGMRWYSFSDYSAAFIVENMQQITDASIRGLKGLSYTKDTDYAEIFAPSGMNINVSVFVKRDADGNFYIDEKQSANFAKALQLREQYPNVGIVATVTDDAALRWAGEQEWTDVIIPFHIVRTGTDVAEYYKWLNYTSESGDTIKDKTLWEAYLDSLNVSESGRKKVSKNIYPSEHKNDKATYLQLCESRGLSPRFVRYAGEPWYMKLVNETRLSADETPALKPIFNEDAAKASFEKFVDKGGYKGGWYKKGVDVDAEARIVADDVLAGHKANEVEYGKQDVDPEALMSGRRANRTHGQHSLSRIGEGVVDENADRRLRPLEVTLPVREDASVTDTNVGSNAPAEQRIDLKYLMAEDDVLPVRDDVQAETSAEEVAPTPEAAENVPITTVSERLSAKKGNYETELESNRANRKQAWANYDAAIAEAQEEYDGLKKKNTKRANDLLRRIDRYKRQQANVDADYAKRISDIEARIGRTDKKIKLTEERKAQLASDIASFNMPKQERESSGKIAKSLTEESGVGRNQRKKRGIVSLVKEYVFDNGMVFEDVAKKHKNRQLEADWNMIRNAKSIAQRFLKRGVDGARSIVDLESKVSKSGLTKQLYDYLHHKHNVDRMSIESRAEAKVADIISKNPVLGSLLERNQSTGDILNDPLFKKYADVLKTDVDQILKLKAAKNLPVFGDTITAEVSAEEVARLEKAHPELKSYAEEIYANNRYLRELLVDEGIITPETAQLWEEMYPHYVPIRRVKLDERAKGKRGKKTGVNAPLKRAEGGNTNIEPIFNTIALRAEQTYKAVLKNRFGVELMNTIKTPKVDSENRLGGEIDNMDSVEYNDALLVPGDGVHNPTFTVFENGERVTFEITEEMYDAMRPTGDVLSYSSKFLNSLGNLFRSAVTEYNLPYMVGNVIKDSQDVLMNSQHPAETYAAIPKAIAQLATKGKYLTEYMDYGGESLSFFNNEKMEFEKKNIPKEVLMTLTGLKAISKANKVVELIPRLSEYIASREAGRSIEISMLDAARVTTNFSAGGKLTKLLNRNGATFLNASVQGLAQNYRNFREAKMNGFKGTIGLIAKTILAGAPAIILNNLIWDDDEEYEELSDYIKQNYYIVAKFGDGKFVRIPKGRTVAVIQDAFNQMSNVITGNDEADFEAFAQLVINNLVPNNPYEDNVASPVLKMLMNETWYGGDLVPTRLQDVPEEEQYDETTDALSKWLGEKINFSPYKINYLLDQYTGGIGDILLPMLTPETETGDDGLVDYATAPLRDKFTTDSVLKNQNVSDFYDLKDDLTVNANSSKATDDDTLKSKYMNAMSDRISELQKMKREIQNGILPDDARFDDIRDLYGKGNIPKDVKYDLTRDLQKEVVALTKEAIDSYENLNHVDDSHTEIGGYYYEWYEPEEGDPYWRKMTESQKTKYLLTKDADGHYVTDGNVHYRLDEDGEWTKISDKQLERQNEVTKKLGISPEEYWSKTEISFFPMSDGEYEYAYENPENYAAAKAVGGYDSYKSYSKDLSGIKADKDENGKSISGSRKEKVLDYINGLDIDYGEKIILFKNEYNADDTYNDDIVDYLNSRDDISYSEMKTILEELGATVDSQGNISW